LKQQIFSEDEEEDSNLELGEIFGDEFDSEDQDQTKKNESEKAGGKNDELILLGL